MNPVTAFSVVVGRGDKTWDRIGMNKDFKSMNILKVLLHFIVC